MSVYRSAKGKPIDMATLTSTNEKTRAVGNMGVNARGDILDSHNRVIRDGSSRINNSYNNTVAEDQKPNLSAARDTLEADLPKVDMSELTAEEQEFEQDDTHEDEEK